MQITSFCWTKTCTCVIFFVWNICLKHGEPVITMCHLWCALNLQSAHKKIIMSLVKSTFMCVLSSKPVLSPTCHATWRKRVYDFNPNARILNSGQFKIKYYFQIIIFCLRKWLTSCQDCRHKRTLVFQQVWQNTRKSIYLGEWKKKRKTMDIKHLLHQDDKWCLDTHLASSTPRSSVINVRALSSIVASL